MAEYIVDSDRSHVPEAWFALYAERELVRCRDCKHAPQGICKLLKWRRLPGDGRAELLLRARREEEAMPMTSACPGCAHEEACGHADVTHCANREPIEEDDMGYEGMMRETRPEPTTWGAQPPERWCSCDRLRKAEAARDRYRAEAIRLQCCYSKAVEPGKCAWLNGDVDADCERVGFPCRAVIEEVDG